MFLRRQKLYSLINTLQIYLIVNIEIKIIATRELTCHISHMLEGSLGCCRHSLDCI